MLTFKRLVFYSALFSPKKIDLHCFIAWPDNMIELNALPPFKFASKYATTLLCHFQAICDVISTVLHYLILQQDEKADF